MKKITGKLKRWAGSMIVHMLILLLLCSAAGAAIAAGIMPQKWIDPTALLLCMISSALSASVMIGKRGSGMELLIHIILIVLLYGILHAVINGAEPYENVWTLLSIALGSLFSVIISGRKRSVKY